MTQQKIQAGQLDPTLVYGSPVGGVGGGLSGSPLTAVHPSPFTVEGAGSPIPAIVLSTSGADGKVTATQGDLVLESLAGSPIQTEIVSAAGPLVFSAGSPTSSLIIEGGGSPQETELVSVVGPLILSAGSPVEQLVRTTSAAVGSLEILRGSPTGVYERVLTIRDAAGNVSKVGSPVDNQLAVFVNGTTIEGDSNLTFAAQIFQVNGRIQVANSGGGAILNEQVTSNNPSIIGDRGDVDTGIGSGGTNSFVIITGGVPYATWRATGAGDGSLEGTYHLTTGLAASTTQTQGQATQNSSEYSEITTVANPNDVITLGGVAVGRKITIVNSGANILQIFPSSGDDLGQGVDTSTTLAVGHSVTFLGLDSINWSVHALSDVGGGSPLSAAHTSPLTVQGVGSPVLSVTITVGAGSPADDTIIKSTTKGGNIILQSTQLTGSPEVAISGVEIDPDGDTTIRAGGVGGSVVLEGLAGSPTQTEIVSAAGPLVLSAGSPASSLIIEGGGSPVQTDLVSAAGPLVLSEGTIQLARTTSITSGALEVKNGATGGSPATFERVLTTSDLIAGSPGVASVAIAGDTMTGTLTLAGSPQPRLLLPLENDEALPTLAFGDGDSGFFESVDDAIGVSLAGARAWIFQAGSFTADASNGPRMMNEAATATNPTLIPHLGDPSTGIGANATGTVSLIANSIECMRFDEASSVVTNQSLGRILVPKGTLSTPAFTFTNDTTTGLHSTGASSLSIITGAVEASRYTLAGSPRGILITNEAAVGLTAADATVGSPVAAQGDGVITSSFNVYSTVVTIGDLATLPAVFEVGTRVYIKNDGGVSMDIFPASGDDAGLGADTPIALAADTGAMFMGTVASATWTQMY